MQTRSTPREGQVVRPKAPEFLKSSQCRGIITAHIFLQKRNFHGRGWQVFSIKNRMVNILDSASRMIHVIIPKSAVVAQKQPQTVHK